MTNDHISHVAVELGDLRDVANWMRQEAQSLTGHQDHLQSMVHFGHHSPCGETHLARRAAMSALAEHRTHWAEHREELVSLASALENALENALEDARDRTESHDTGRGHGDDGDGG